MIISLLVLTLFLFGCEQEQAPFLFIQSTTTTSSGNITDTNNYTTSINFAGNTLNLARSGMSTLTASIPNNAINLSILNITGLDTNQCSGTDKVKNVTFQNGDLIIVCDTDTGGGGGGGVTNITVNQTLCGEFYDNTTFVFRPCCDGSYCDTYWLVNEWVSYYD